ncbi:non-ribosomal peptide synthetase [Streptomyces flavofungini]|uniref:non-ribosomal peptide synthetase n=1 Tax=Streptomyces flavofungini TaxID=68200 RepID=UPI0025B1F063|nr:non-ribosomal peptide synthetase [Streptomyces flavofungini]WJV44939.1 amino acid adenylation domain-containing protein [Streptomyces flavofungini]
MTASESSAGADRLEQARRALAARRPGRGATTSRVPRRADQDQVVLSESQLQLWTAHALDPTGSAYTVPAALDIEGPLDADALTRAFDWMLARHEGLRLVTDDVRGKAHARLLPTLPPLRRTDLTRLAATDAEAAERRRDELTDAELRAPFALDAGGALARGLLIALAPERHRLVVAFHHLVVDGLSVSVLIQELTAAYEAFRTGSTPPSAPEGPSYTDYAWWEHTSQDAPSREASLAHWRAELDGAPRGLSLPFDHPRPDARGHHGHHLVRPTGPALRERVEKFAAGCGVSVFAVLYGAWRAVLHRAALTDDLVIGVPVANRVRPELRATVGPFINTLALRSRLRDGATLRDLAQDSAATVARSLDHQHVPTSSVVAAVGGSTGAPLFGAMFAYLGEDRSALGLGEAVMTPVPVETAASKTDVTLSVSHRGDDLELMLEYDTELLREHTAGALLDAYVHLLTSGLDAPDREVRLLPLAAPAVPEGPVAESLVTHGLDHAFLRSAARHPARVALHWEGEDIAYGELADRVETLARHLVDRGVAPGDRVPLYLERGPAQIVAILAVLRAGAAYVPLDLRNPADRIRHVLDDSGGRLLVCGAQGAGTLGTDLPQVCVDGHGRPLAGADPVDPSRATLPARHPGDVAYVIYTSGSTGRPKGVEVADAQVLRLYTSTARRFDFGPHDVWTFFHSYAFDVSVWELWGALLHGGKLALVPDETAQSPADLLALVERLGVTVFSQTPSAFKGVVAADAAEGSTRELALRHVVFGGERLDPNTLRPWIEARGDRSPVLVNMYGITETTVHSTFRVITADDLGDRTGSPIGVPIDDLTLHVLDAALNPLPAGLVGELHVGGAGVTLGYAGRGGLTAERFVPDPFSDVPGARLYRSGDLARVTEDGEFEYWGRADAQVKIRGFRIELGEVEVALAAHPGVAAAVADVRGEQLVVWLVPAAGELPDVPELREHASGLLPSYMVPAVYTALDEVPLTVNGKADRRALPDPAEARLDAGTEYTAPRTGLEETVAGVWADVLGVERVGVHDNFFALGGDSIRAVEISGTLRALGHETRVHAVFKHQTVAEFATHLAGSGAETLARAEPFEMISAEDRAALPADAEDAYPLSATQAGMLYHLHLHPEAGIYHNTVSVRMRGRLDAELLRRALTDTMDRHPVLRTSISLDGYSEPLQIVHRDVPPLLTVRDLSGLDAAAQRAEIDDFVAQEREDHLDLERAPLQRLAVHLLGDDEFQLTVSENHVILDGWSWTSTVTEIFSRQAALLDDAPDYGTRWPELPLRYADFIKTERDALEGADVAEVWRRRMADAEPRSVADLRPAGLPQVRRVQVDVDPDTSQRLARLAKEEGLPFKSLAVGVHFKVLAEALAVTDPVTGMVMHGRPDLPGAKDLRGLFINMLPTSLSVPGGSWRELARRAFDEERGLLEHRHTPLINVQQALGNDPLFDVGVNFVRFHALSEVLDTGVVELLDHHPASAEDTNYAVMATYSVHPPANELGLILAYDSDRVSDEWAADLATMYAQALRRFATDPDAPHEAASLLPYDAQAAARRADGGPLVVPGGTLHEAIEAVAAARPGAVAVTGPGGVLTYRQLTERARAAADGLTAAGVRRGDLVAVVARRGVDLVTGLLAAMTAGAAYVPVDPELPLERITHLIRDSGCRTALTAHLTEDDAAVLALLAEEGITVRTVAEAAAATDAAVPQRADAADLAYLIYTSGSTGTPKGVGVSHHNLLAYLEASGTVVAPTADDVVAVRSTFTFDLSVWELFAGLVAGSRIHLVPGDVAADAQQLHGHLRGEGVTMLATTPTIAQELAAVDGSGDTGGVPLGLRALLLAGEEVVPARFADWFEGPSAQGCRVFNWYGPTEATVLMTVAELTAEVTRRQRAPIGAPVPGSTIWVLDEHMQPVPPGAAGELYIGGVQVAQGYWRRPGLTAGRFIPDPFAAEPGARLYRTGDRARHRADGQLEFLGRFDNQVKLRGHRIELGEVESVLVDHPGVTDCVVVVHGAAGATPRLVAYVVAESGGLDRGELRTHAAGRLPRYALPAAIRLVEEIPQTPSGKLDRRRLPAPTADDFLGTSGSAEPPRDDVERELLAIWQDLLGLEGLGIRDHFYEAGGHSLLATRLLLRVRREFGVRLRVQQAMADFTVAGIGELIKSARESTGGASARRAGRR